MFDLLLLFLINIVLAFVVQNRTASYANGKIGVQKDIQSKLCYIVIVFGFILFSGLRTQYNDTTTYMYGFEIFDKNLNFKNIFEEYGGFDLFQSLIKRFISTDPQALIFVSAIVCNLLYLPFILKYSKHFSESVFMFCIEDFIFLMAGIKQAIAIGIALYAISSYLNKKYFKAIVLLLLSMTFHPYVICLVAVPFFTKRIWDFRTMVVVFVCFILFANMELVFGVLEVIGKDYSDTNFNDYTINPMRVLVEAVPIVISFIYRNKINKSDSIILKLGINMQILSFVFIFMGLFVNPIYLGRMASYFTALSAIAVPEMLHICWDDEKNGKVYKALYYIFFFAYFMLDMTKIGSISILKDQFKHTTIGNIFKIIGK